jgi:hypothetical protein
MLMHNTVDLTVAPPKHARRILLSWQTRWPLCFSIQFFFQSKMRLATWGRSACIWLFHFDF